MLSCANCNLCTLLSCRCCVWFNGNIYTWFLRCLGVVLYEAPTSWLIMSLLTLLQVWVPTGSPPSLEVVVRQTATFRLWMSFPSSHKCALQLEVVQCQTSTSSPGCCSSRSHKRGLQLGTFSPPPPRRLAPCTSQWRFSRIVRGDAHFSTY